MPSVADCLRQHEPAYLQAFGEAVPLGHRKVLSAITRCRTGELGGVLYECQRCGREHWVGRSCGNRHCPTCGIDKTATWLDKQTRLLLPIEHFLITFTVPWELRRVVRANQEVCYDAMFQCGSQTIRELASNPKWLGTSKLGFFGVLQTWGRDLTVYHPHVHFVVPGGGVSEDGSRWLSTAAGFFFPEPCASPIIRGKMRDTFAAAGLKDQVDAKIWAHDKWWEVDVKAVGDGRAVLKYLAPYVYRVAISDKRIEACDSGGVTFRYTPQQVQSQHDADPHGQPVRGRLLAACLTEWAEEDSLLRLDEFQLQDPHRRSSLVSVVVFGLEVLAGQRLRAATGTDRARAGALCSVWGRNADRRHRQRELPRTGGTQRSLLGQRIGVTMNHKLAKQQPSSRGPPLTVYADRGKTVGQRPLSAQKMLIGVVRLAGLPCYRRGMNRLHRAATTTSGSLPMTEGKQNS